MAPPPLAEAISERLQRELPTRRERASADHSLPARGRERPTIAPPIEARLGEDRTMHSTTPITADPDAPAGAGVVTWSVANLQRAGLPASIVDACWELNTDDEFIWMRAITRAVSVFCRPLPRGAAVIAGPRALRLANGLRIPTAKVGGLPPYGGTVGLRVKDDEKSRAWFREVRGERWLHLVVGGRRCQGLLHDEPLAVSWVGHDALPEALSLCARFGLVLGYGISDEREAPAVRATPTDVAVAIRSLMPRG